MYYHVNSEMKKKIWSILGKQYLYLNKIQMVGYIYIYIYIYMYTYTELTQCISIYVLFLSTILIFVLFFENN